MKYIKCITDKYGNFTKDKLYPIESKMVRVKDNKPTNFYIKDDEHDTLHIKNLLKQNEFIVVCEAGD